MLDNEQDGGSTPTLSSQDAAALSAQPATDHSLPTAETVPDPSRSGGPAETASTEERPATAAPRRRRAASRPAGPPVPVTEGSQESPTGDRPVGSQEEAATGDAGTTEEPAQRPARKTAAKRAPRKAATASTDEAEPPAAPRKRAPRKTTAKKTAAAGAVVSTGEPGTFDGEAAASLPSGSGAPLEEPLTAEPQSEALEAPQPEPLAVDPFAVPELDMPSVTTAAEGTSPQGLDEAAAGPESEEEVPSDGTAAGDTPAEEAPVGEIPAAELPIEAVEPAEDRAEELGLVEAGPTEGDSLAEVPPTEPQAEIEGAEGQVDETQIDETVVDETVVDEDQVDEDQVDEDQVDDTQTDDTGSRRRRRRRGGRRRRRSGDAARSDEDEGDDDSADEEGDAEQVPVAEEVGDEPREGGEEETDEAEGGESDGQHRRRRRRRRRGEESAAAPDEPSDVVVRVREPRSRRKASSEVTGIDGSTRMEAKRQRRREGREAGRRRTPILSEAEFLARRESVNRRMVIRQREDLTQIAVLEDDILVEHYVDRDSAASLIGNVYLGRVQNVLPSMEAAFIDIGRGRNAVLYAGEVDWDSFGANGPDRKVENVLKSGQTILVQVSKDPVGAKGARLTNHVSIPGRYIVYAPGGHLSGISRKLPDVERRRLKDILADLVGDSASVIVRTAAEGASEEELVRDVNRLKAQWADIEKKVKAGQAPQLLYGEPDLTLRIVRDLFTEDFGELVIAGHGGPNDAYEAVTNYITHIAPHLNERIVRWDREEDPFAAYRLDEQIAKGLERKVFLPSGGSLVIDRTEAMTVIDVNTGKFTGAGGNLEATVTSNNLEAAEEIVRQLRLRDIGGIIVIDFIDMVLPSNRELLLRRLVECLGRDRTRHQVAEVTSLGLVQMTRKRIGTGLYEAFTSECPHCHGSGVELHDLPVESQRQADGGTRERGRQRASGGSKAAPARTSEAHPSEEATGEEPVAPTRGRRRRTAPALVEEAANAEVSTVPPAEGAASDRQDETAAVESHDTGESGSPDTGGAEDAMAETGAGESGERRPRSRRRRNPRASEPAPVG